MKKLFWILVLIGGYYWVIANHQEAFVLEKAKALYAKVVLWLEDAELQWHLPKNQVDSQKKPRRWD